MGPWIHLLHTQILMLELEIHTMDKRPYRVSFGLTATTVNKLLFRFMRYAVKLVVASFVARISRVTPWMKSHHDGIIKTRGGSVESLNESCGSCSSVDECGNSGTLKAGDGNADLSLSTVDNLKKRKDPLPLEEDAEPDYSVSVPIGAAARIICNLDLANFDALLALKEDTTRAAVLAREIVKSHEPLIYYLKSIVLLENNKFLDKEALMMTKSLLELTDNLIPLKKYLSNKYNSLLEKQGVLVLELIRHFLIES